MYTKDKDILHIIPTAPGRTINIDGYNDIRPGQKGRKVPFYDYELDDNWEIKKDDKGIPIVKKDADGKPQTIHLFLQKLSVIELHKVKDKAFIDQLKNCPHCEGVTEWNGTDATGCGKWFKISDPEKEESAIKEQFQLEEKAYQYAHALGDERIFYHCILLTQIYGHPELNPANLEGYRLRREYTQYASRSPKEYITHIMENKQLGLEMLVALAMQEKLISNKPNSGYTYLNQDRQSISMGTSIKAIYAMLSDGESAALRKEIERRCGFEKYVELDINEASFPEQERQFDNVLEEKDAEIARLTAELESARKRKLQEEGTGVSVETEKSKRAFPNFRKKGSD